VISSLSVDWPVESFATLKKAALVGSFFMSGFLRTL